MVLFTILAWVLIEVLLALVALIIIGFGAREFWNAWRKSKADLAKERFCRSELQRLVDLLVDQQRSPSREKCQAVNIKINVWNAECGRGTPLPLLDCERIQ